jgi:hypothetical protein
MTSNFSISDKAPKATDATINKVFGLIMDNLLTYLCVSGDEQIQFSEPASENVKSAHKCNILLHVLLFYKGQ